MTTKNIPKICITGGPCGGKDSLQPYVVEHLSDRGYKPYIIPEAATLLINGGMDKMNPDFQNRILETVIHLEDSFQKAALMEGHVNPVLLCNRGTMDGLAYCDENYFHNMLQGYNYTIPELRDLRYNAVIHMITAADGALEFYTLENNKARNEGPGLAKILDTKTQHAWLGHQHLRVIDNSTDFEKKKKRALQEICRVLGIPEPLEIERKFLVDQKFDTSGITVPHAKIYITQHYLEQKEENTIERVRKRAQFNSPLYIHTIKKTISKGTNIEIERFISQAEYVEFLERQDRERFPVSKIRVCFLWKNQYFEMDFICSPIQLNLLELEVMSMDDSISFPSFIPIVREVTGERDYSNAVIATNKPRT
jgi:CYTH domain-containing protein